jgi:hypothetical protein
MRSILAGVILLSALAALVHNAEALDNAQIHRGYGHMQAPVGHRQPTQSDEASTRSSSTKAPWLKQIEKDNEQLDLPTKADVKGADQVQLEENALAKKIEQENERIDRQVRGICRGC